jgi:riboflavin synthase
MFTGIIEAIGTVQSCGYAGKSRTLVLELAIPKFSKSLKIGGSLAVNGVCLTVVKKKKTHVFFNVIRETVNRSTIGQMVKGDRINLERPVKAGGRLDGHIVLGHVDGVGTVKKIEKKGREKSFFIACPTKLKPYFFEKGSVAVDGVSLTIGKVKGAGFWVHCIPHTLKVTAMGRYEENTRVNIEADILAKKGRKKFKLG